jgi:hypothetical protein
MHLPEADGGLLAELPGVEQMAVLRCTGGDVPMQEDRDVYWHDLAAEASEDPQPCSVRAVM